MADQQDLLMQDQPTETSRAVVGDVPPPVARPCAMVIFGGFFINRADIVFVAGATGVHRLTSHAHS